MNICKQGTDFKGKPLVQQFKGPEEKTLNNNTLVTIMPTKIINNDKNNQ